MKKYQSYKPSGVEWIGGIPEHWENCRLKHVSKSINGYSFKSEDFDREYEIPVIRIGDVGDIIDFNDCVKVESRFLEEKKDFIVNRNDILIGLTGGTIGKSGKYNYDFPSLLNQRVGLLRNKSNVLNGLLYHYVKSEIFIRYIFYDCYGGGQDNISMNDILNMVFPLPPLHEQNQIVQFLDSKTELIDKLISTKERKITLLKEQRKSLINQVVTKGLNPNVRMKDSGVEWIGEIPEEWIMTRVSNFGKFFKGNGIKKDEVKSEGFPCIRYGEIYTKYDRVVYTPISFIDEETTKNSVSIKKGDILFTGSGETIEDIGKSVLYYGEEDIFVGGDIIVLRLYQDFNPLYLSYLLNTSFIQYQKSLMGRGEIIVHIYSKNIKEIKTPIPPIPEQHQIVQFLDSKTKEIDEFIQLEKKKIDLLKEYRQSLISEVVTGKIKVTTDE